ncbi:hypothetical protein GCM10009741_79220 [Kribbella lupini]|uniref:Uncharacterized protein n=2 Tax=Kribbella lupini TaxID=291602 RepID=A0ABN2CPB7_9ACTN
MDHRRDQRRPDSLPVHVAIWYDVVQPIEQDTVRQLVEMCRSGAASAFIEEVLQCQTWTGALLQQTLHRCVDSRVLRCRKVKILVSGPAREHREVSQGSYLGDALHRTEGVRRSYGVRMAGRVGLHPRVGGFVENGGEPWA